MCSFLIILAGLWAGADAPAASGPADGALDPGMPDPRLAPLLEQLGHPRFEVRERATIQLSSLDERYLPELARRFHREPRYEMKLRIRHVIESIFYRRVIHGRDGFLGVSISKAVEPKLTDPATGKTTPGVVLSKVHPGFAADRAGLKDEDVIIMFDGQPIPEDPISDSFVKMVSVRPPGSVNSLRVLRPSPNAREVPLTVGAEPAQTLAGGEFSLADQWFRAVGVAPGSAAAAAGLKTNDIITRINDTPVSEARARRSLVDLLKSMRPGDSLRLTVRDVAAVPVTVTLGARPAEMIQEERDIMDARRRFIEWWQGQGGEVFIPDSSASLDRRPSQPPDEPVPVVEISILP